MDLRGPISLSQAPAADTDASRVNCLLFIMVGTIAWLGAYDDLARTRRCLLKENMTCTSVKASRQFWLWAFLFLDARSSRELIEALHKRRTRRGIGDRSFNPTV